MTTDNKVEAKEPDLNRRNMLIKLGLAAGAIYAAPIVMSLSEAEAQGRRSWSDRPGRRRGRGRRSWSDRRRRRRVRRSWSDRRRRRTVVPGIHLQIR